MICAASINTAETLHQRFMVAWKTIQHCIVVIEMGRQSMIWRVHVCLQESGGHFWTFVTSWVPMMAFWTSVYTDILLCFRVRQSSQNAIPWSVQYARATWCVLITGSSSTAYRMFYFYFSHPSVLSIWISFNFPNTIGYYWQFSNRNMSSAHKS